MKYSKEGVYVHPDIFLSNQRAQGHFCVFGTTGSGKSTFIKSLVFQAMQLNKRIFVFDEKKEYTKILYQEERSVLIAAWDKRGTPWNIARDASNRSSISLIASCMLPDRGEKDAIWVKGARLIFRGMMTWLQAREKQWGWSELSRMLSLDQATMHKGLLRHFPSAAQLISEKGRTTQGFYIQLISELDWIEDLAEAWPQAYRSSFSIRDWLSQESEHRTLIVQSDSRFSNIGSPLCSALLSLLSSYFLALPERDCEETWLFIDEAASLPFSPCLIKWLELARSRGGRAVIGTQSLSQLRDIYGIESSNTLLNLTSNVISMRMGAAGEEAEFASSIFQKRTVERPSSSAENATWSRIEENVVSPADLVNLPPKDSKGIWGFLMIPGWDAVYKLQWPFFDFPDECEDHIPAHWLKSWESQ